MRHQFTTGQIKMLVLRAERQLAQIAGQPAGQDAVGRNIARSSHLALHETVVGMTRLFRDHVPGAAGVATLIAREYAKGVDAKSNAPTLACVQAIESLVRQAREQYLSSDVEIG
jgi:hypothetical protein